MSIIVVTLIITIAIAYLRAPYYQPPGLCVELAKISAAEVIIAIISLPSSSFRLGARLHPQLCRKVAVSLHHCTRCIFEDTLDRRVSPLRVARQKAVL